MLQPNGAPSAPHRPAPRRAGKQRKTATATPNEPVETMTREQKPEEPSVMGGGAYRSPMPTQEDFRAAHKAVYVSLFVAIGVPEETAAGWHDEGWEEIREMTPQEAFDEETSYWDQD
jgi:hypothetical protein